MGGKQITKLINGGGSGITNDVSKHFPKLKTGTKYKRAEMKLGLSLNSLLSSLVKFEK